MKYIIITWSYEYAGNRNEYEKKLFSNIQSAKNYILSKEETDFKEGEIIEALAMNNDLEPQHSWGGNCFKIEDIDFVE